MPPKNKEVYKKVPPAVVRPSISNSSLVTIPDNAVEGFEERLETGIDWTLAELAIRHHKRYVRNKKDVPALSFTQALENKMKHSILNGFLNEMSNISLDQQWEVILATSLWDVDKFANDEEKICFHNSNCLTNDLLNLIQKAVRANNREVLREQMQTIDVLRVTDEQMTHLDKRLFEFDKLLSLNLCGNYIQNIDAAFIPQSVRSLELQANLLIDFNFAEFLPLNLLYLGLAKNMLTDVSIDKLSLLPRLLTVLDLSNNDIYHLQPVLDVLVILPNLNALYLAGNPCSVCAGYARLTLMTLRNLEWLDARQILSTDRSPETLEVHPDDLRSSYFFFTVFRIMSVPQPPKPEKGALTTFHVELEIPLLDVARRRFLLFRRNESLTEMLPPPEDEEEISNTNSAPHLSKSAIGPQLDEASFVVSDVYDHLVAKSSREIKHFTIFESTKAQWAKIINFQEPTVKIFCPDLIALRNTFRSVITVKLVYSVVNAKPSKSDKRSIHTVIKVPVEQRVVLATIRCTLRNPDWSQHSQHFHWDDSLGTEDAKHWGDGDLSSNKISEKLARLETILPVLQYGQVTSKPVKGKQDTDTIPSARQSPPDNLTCHFGFGIETLRFM